MKKHFYILSLKKILIWGAILCCMFLLMVESPTVIAALQDAILLCGRVVIPSLFPFFVVSTLLTSGSLIHLLTKCLSPVMKPLFRINGAGALPLSIGLLSGYPTGAKVTVELFQNGAVSRAEALRLLPFTNNSGPLFMIAAVGTSMLGNHIWGVYLYLIHIVSALLVGLCFRFYGSSSSAASTAFSRKQSISLAEAISGSIHTMLTVCGYILFFSAITACLTPLCNRLPAGFALFCKAIPEVTAGDRLIVSAGLPFRLTLTALSALTGFGGVCVLMQVSGIVSHAGLPMTTYTAGKLLQGLFSGIITYCSFPLFFSETEAVCLPGAPQSFAVFPFISALLLSAILLFCGLKLLLMCMDLV